MRKKAPTRLPSSLLQNNKNAQQAPSQSINKVYSMLNKQQETIANLLSKYGQNSTTLTSNRDNIYDNHSNNNGMYDLYLKPRSQTIDTDLNSSIKLKVMLTKNQIQQNNNLYHSSRLKSRERRQNSVQSYRNRSQSLSLPIIKQKKYVKQYKPSKNKVKNKYEMLSYFAKDRKHVQHDLYKIYGEKNGYFNQIKYEQRQPKVSSIQKKRKKSLKKSRSKSKLSNSKSGRQSQQFSQQSDQNDKNNKNDQQFEPNNNMIQSDDDQDSQAQQIPTMYYQRQFRDAMRAQCLQELNFLYFSKNQQMKDWTDSLLSMIEKHDKEILGIRKKSKYLHTFDDKFFSIGIFNNDDL